jgi:hypothetical protein
MRNIVKSIGVLRSMLDGLGIVYILLMPFSSPKRVLEGWDLFWGGILPATAPLIIVVIFFDVMMSQVLKGEADAERQQQLTLITRVHLSVASLLLLFWLYSFRNVLFL